MLSSTAFKQAKPAAFGSLINGSSVHDTWLPQEHSLGSLRMSLEKTLRQDKEKEELCGKQTVNARQTLTRVNQVSENTCLFFLHFLPNKRLETVF